MVPPLDTQIGVNGATTYFNGGGNMGIGTNSPSHLLHLSQAAPGSSVDTMLLANGSGDNGAGARLYLSGNDNAGRSVFIEGRNVEAGSANEHALIFGTSSAGASPTERLRIDPLGNVGIGTTSPGYKLHVNGSVAGVGAYNNLSDKRMKRDIASIENPVEQLLQIRGVTYDWRRSQYPDIDFPEGRDMGVIAQDVKAVFPQAVSEADDGILSVAYSKLIAPIIEAIRELHQKSVRHSEELAQLKAEKDQEITELKRANSQKDQKISELEKRLERIEKALAQ